MKRPPSQDSDGEEIPALVSSSESEAESTSVSSETDVKFNTPTSEGKSTTHPSSEPSFEFNTPPSTQTKEEFTTSSASENEEELYVTHASKTEEKIAITSSLTREVKFLNQNEQYGSKDIRCKKKEIKKLKQQPTKLIGVGKKVQR